MSDSILVSLFTDASLCGQTDVAAWASWGKSTRGTFRDQGILPVTTKNTTLAELMAIVLGIESLIANAIALRGDKFLLQSDSKQALQILRDSATSGRGTWEDHKETLNYIFEYKASLEQAGYSFIYKHIKGHSGSDTPRTWVHSDCDTRAKEQMRRARFLLAKGKLPSPTHPIKGDA